MRRSLGKQARGFRHRGTYARQVMDLLLGSQIPDPGEVKRH
jgi:hypothetical protein